MTRLILTLLAATTLQASAWTPLPAAGSRRRRAASSTVTSMATEARVTVALPGLDGRETTLKRSDVEMLNELRNVLPGDLGVGGTHVVFLPGREQDQAAFDTALGALGVLGLHAIRADMPKSSWDETTGRIHQTIGAIKEHMHEKKGELGGKGKLKNKNGNWARLFDTEMLAWSLQPVFSQLEKASSDAGLPVCDHLLLVGCEDGAWVLQAFLCELDRLGLKPRLDISMVALGSKSDSIIAKAVQAVYPERLNNVKYLSVHGLQPYVASEEEMAADEDVLGVGELSAEKQQELDDSNQYGYGTSDAEAMDAMSCFLSPDGMTEECILSAPGSGSKDAVESWYSSPSTIVRWIVKALM